MLEEEELEDEDISLLEDEITLLSLLELLILGSLKIDDSLDIEDSLLTKVDGSKEDILLEESSLKLEFTNEEQEVIVIANNPNKDKCFILLNDYIIILLQ